MMPAEAATHQALLASMTGATLAVTPVCRGRGGHPVIVHRSVLAPYEAQARPDALAKGSALPSLRDVLAAADAERRRVEVDDENVLGDLDTPSDVHALLSGRGGDHGGARTGSG